MTTSNAPVLILGARSDIARAIAAEYAKQGHPLQLAARGLDTLEREASDLKARYQIDVSTYHCDVTDFGQHEKFIDGLDQLPSIVVCAVGALGSQENNAANSEASQNIFDTNFVGPVMLLERLAKQMACCGNKTAIIGIASVAGDRGRAKNYIYGSAKAGFATYLSGMRQKYVDTSLQIMTVKPGFVRTAMTEDMDTPELLTTDAQSFAKRVVRAQVSGKLVYYDFRWRILMAIICTIPEFIFQRMKF